MGAQWKVKHKEAAANAKGKLFGKLVKEITIAARNGADISTNAHLRLVVEQAKKASMPRDTLERAIRKVPANWAKPCSTTASPMKGLPRTRRR